MSSTMIPLGKVADFVNGVAFKAEEWADEGRPIIRIQNLNDASKAFNRTKRFVPDRHLARRGDLLVSWAASLGVYEWQGDEACINQHIFKVLPRDQLVDRAYLRRALQNSIALMELKMHGATMKHITRDKFLAVKIPLPSLAEQRSIAAVLDSAEMVCNKLREFNAKLDQLIESVFIETFGEPVSNSKQWPIHSLGSICDVRDGTHDSPKYVESGFPLVTSKNLAGGSVNLEGCSLISENDYHSINKRSKVELGDILMPMIGTIGNPVRVNDPPNFAIKNIALMKFGGDASLSYFILYLLRSHYFAVATANKNRGGTQKFLALGDLRKLPIPLPDEEALASFARFLSSFAHQRNQATCATVVSDHLFKSLKSSAFAGTSTRQTSNI